MNSAEAMPSSTPPASDAQGVKFVQSMVMVMSLWGEEG